MSRRGVPIMAGMSSRRWKPAVTVAAVIEQAGRYLLVEERTAAGLQLNTPAGHLEPGESPQAGAVREALEETGRVFTPTALLGVYLAASADAQGAPAGRGHRAHAVADAGRDRGQPGAPPQPAGVALRAGSPARPAL